MSQNPEEALGKILVPWLKDQGYEVYQEVRFGPACLDVVATKNKKISVFELKTAMCLKLVQQCFDSTRYADEVFAVIPPGRNTAQYLPMLKKLQIGVITVSMVAALTKPGATKAYFRAIHADEAGRVVKVLLESHCLGKQKRTLRKALHPEQQDWAPAGSRFGAGWAPWRRTVKLLEEYVAAQQSEVRLWTAVHAIKHHYTTSKSAAAAGCLSLIEKRLTKLEVYKKPKSRFTYVRFRDAKET